MRFLLAILCVLLASTVFRLGWAEVLARADSAAPAGESLARGAARGAELEGGWNAAHLEYLAEVSAAGGDSERARMLLRQATQANPRQVSAWLALGLRAEAARDFAEAEASLKEASRLDRQFLPAWTLTNYYFRRANREGFWTWAQRAAAMTYDDFRPLFRLCDFFEPDAVRVMNHLSGEDSRDQDRRHQNPRYKKMLLRSYVFYLAGEGRRLDAAETAAWRLLIPQDPGDRPAFLNLITREINANRISPAVALWSAVSTPLDSRHGPVLTNGELDSKPTGEGFDWSLPPCAGVIAEWQPALVAFNLSGRQPDDCVLLDQPIPTASRRQYHLRFESRTHDRAEHAGQSNAVRWEASDHALATLVPRSDSWQVSEGLFRSPADTLVRLRLVCRRAPGTLAFEGRIEIRHVRLEVE